MLVVFVLQYEYCIYYSLIYNIKKMNNLKVNFYSLSLILISFLSTSCELSRQEKTIAIIEKMNLLELQQSNFSSQLYALKSMKTKNDSLNIVDIEKQLSEEKIIERICFAFDD